MSDEDLREEKPRRSAFGRVMLSLFLFGALAVVIAGGLFVFAQNQLQQKGPLETAKIVTVKRGMGTDAIAKMLADEGIISNAGLFSAATYAYRSTGGSLKAGEFEIPAGASMVEVIKLLQAGKSLAYKVTIPEGWTTQKALERIAANKVLRGEITVKPPEGTLLPDTYVFQRGTTRDALIKRMRDAQKTLLDELWQKRSAGLPIKTKAQALTLASIVERETGIGAERKKVAAVFVNRLNKKMRLQSDPTIIYGIVGGKGKMDRPLSKKDIATKTAYNTYQIDGLPPTPIANPGRAAIAAVLNPGVSDELYFVADGTGGHAFAKTLRDHEANVAKWRKIERDRRKAATNKTKEAAKAAKQTKDAPPLPPTVADKKPTTGASSGKGPKEPAQN